MLILHMLKKWRVNASYLKFNFNGKPPRLLSHILFNSLNCKSKLEAYNFSLRLFMFLNGKLFVYIVHTNGKLAANVDVLRSFWIIIMMIMITNPSNTACTHESDIFMRRLNPDEGETWNKRCAISYFYLN